MRDRGKQAIFLDTFFQPTSSINGIPPERDVPYFNYKQHTEKNTYDKNNGFFACVLLRKLLLRKLRNVK